MVDKERKPAASEKYVSYCSQMNTQTSFEGKENSPVNINLLFVN